MITEAKYKTFLNRKGRFAVSYDFIESKEMDFEDKLSIFKDIFILDCRCEYHSQKVIYIGVSKLFDEVMEGQIVPEYTCILSRDNSGEITYKWVKVE